MDDTWIIIGLGNPGRKYEMTRHNIGFVTVLELAHRHGIKLNKQKHRALVGETILSGQKVVFALPQTYMNNSGESVRELISWYKATPDKCLVIYDDIDIDTGTIRIRESGSAGTHNGMRSIIFHLNDDKFPRLRIGIGRPENEGYDLADFVLGRFPKKEHTIMLKAVMRAADAVEKIVKSGVVAAMNLYNSGI